MEKINTKAQTTKQKKNRIPFIITLVVIVLLFAAVEVYANFFVAPVDQDIVIAQLVNETVGARAFNSGEAYINAKEAGYVLDDLALSSASRKILWDSKNSCYALYDGAELIYTPAQQPGSGTELWEFVSKVPTESEFSVYWVGEQKVTKQVEENDITVDKDFYYSEHVYTVTVNADSQTYTCKEKGCDRSYTVKIAE